MLKEISSDDVELKTLLIPIVSDRLPGPAIIHHGGSNHQSIITTRLLEQGKKTFSHQPSYLKLIEEESNSPVAEQIDNLERGIVFCAKGRYQCLSCILLVIASIILIFLLGFALGQTLESQSIVASSSSPPPKHPSICIKSDSRFNHFNTSFAQFKYAVFQISIIVASNYTFSTKDDVNTHIGIYNNTFYRENPKLNLLAQSEKSELTFFLQPWTSYMVLVIPLYSDRIGRFSIVACGPLRFALRPIQMPPLHQTRYSSEWTAQSAVYCRDRCSMSDYDYDQSMDYYYKAIRVNVNQTGDFTLTSVSSINTYGYLYENSFDPSNKLVNLLMEDDNSGSNGQFQMTTSLRSSTSYVLVITTFLPSEIGKFSVIASGVSSISLTRLSSHRSTTTTSEPTTLSTVQSRYNGYLDRNSPLSCRGDCSVFDHYYEAVVVSVGQSGTYNFLSDSTFDAYGVLYGSSFDPIHPHNNLLAADDDSGGTSEFKLMATLQSQSTYILVVTTYSPYITGTFQITASGPTTVQFVRATNPSTSVRTTTTSIITTTTEKNTRPWSVQSTYSSASTMDSSSYCRTSSCANSPSYYYEAMVVRVSISGSFSLASKSMIDTYGYLYNDTFDSLSPSSNLLLQDDEGSSNGQFKLTYFLQSELIYVLVATTFYPNTIGSFSISGSGPGVVTFSTYASTQNPITKS